MQSERCHHCNYDLAGLSPRGTCPECGKPYNAGSMYRETHRAQDFTARHGKWITLGVLAVLILICGGAITLNAQNRMAGVVITLFVAALPGFGAFVYWWSDRVERRDSE